jgi:hypothetical protein
MGRLWIQTDMFPWMGESHGVHWAVIRRVLRDPDRAKQSRYCYTLHGADGAHLFTSSARFQRPQSAAQAAVADIAAIEGMNAEREGGRPRLVLLGPPE